MNNEMTNKSSIRPRIRMSFASILPRLGASWRTSRYLKQGLWRPYNRSLVLQKIRQSHWQQWVEIKTRLKTIEIAVYHYLPDKSAYRTSPVLGLHFSD